RFGNVIGERTNHGVIYDFIGKLKKDPHCLEVLGTGRGEKNYFLVEECIHGMLFTYHRAEQGPFPVLVNLGTDSVSKVMEIARIIIEEMDLGNVAYRFTGTPRGWPGDQPVVLLDTSRIHELGWYAKRTSNDAVRIATRRLLGKEKFSLTVETLEGPPSCPQREKGERKGTRINMENQSTVCVIGIWHLGVVNAVGFAEKGYRVIGVEFDPAKADRLQQGMPPLFEPGLEEMMARHLKAARLRFANEPRVASEADFVVIAYDTPVNDRDEVDITPIVQAAEAVAPFLRPRVPVVITSQIPLGTSEQIEASIR